ncbi:MAG: peptidoglycan-binding domain-containing protein [Candidatus Paceibacterota bacterium]|jgi:peptidoglycan hydrolase-like protein with peptidoglycan-binding domain
MKKIFTIKSFSITTLGILVLVGVFMVSGKVSQAQVFSTISSSLGLGSTGTNVNTLQSLLSTDRHVYPQALVTGYYGPLTQAAVTQFQIGYNISPVGVVGPVTLQKINSLILSGSLVDVTAPQVTSLSIDDRTSNSVRFVLTTGETARAKIFYDTRPLVTTEATQAKTEPFVSGSVMEDASFDTSKSLRVQNLSSSMTYYYLVEVIDRSGNVSIASQGTFVTR